MKGYIHSIETLGALDGPGLRTVVFFSFCPMRCKFCHNADTWGQGEEWEAEKLVEFCKRYKNYYGKFGGVTLSGGEPLMQKDFCLAVLKGLLKEDINVAIDTGGGLFEKEILSLASLIILDIKHTDKEAFYKLTGVSQDNLIKTLEYLNDNDKKFWVRQVIIPGITDGEENIKKLKKMSGKAEKIELLPYHTMGAEKWEKLGIVYPLEGINPPSNETMEKLNKILLNKVL